MVLTGSGTSPGRRASPGRTPQLLALGGGGFTDQSSSAIDQFALDLAETDEPSVCLIPTASGDASAYVAEFYKVFAGRTLSSHLSLFQRGDGDLRQIVLGQDILYIGGGSTANLLAVWRVHGLDTIVREAWQAGVVIVGVSAGACALFEAGVSASFGTVAPLMDGLGLIAGGFCPHYETRRPTLLEMLETGLSLGFGADGGAALHFVGTELAGAVGIDAHQRAFRVEAGPSETPIPVRLAE